MNQPSLPPIDTARDKDGNDNNSHSSTSSYVNDNDGTDDKLPTLHHRFIRLNPRFEKEETLRLLKVGWLVEEGLCVCVCVCVCVFCQTCRV